MRDYKPMRLGACLAVAMCILFAPACKGKRDSRSAVPTKEVLVLPRSYSGPLTTIYSQRDAEPERWVGDTVLYTVPATGLLRIYRDEPPHSTRISAVLANEPDVALEGEGTCDDIELQKGEHGRICWFDYMVPGSHILHRTPPALPEWGRFGRNIQRASFLFDSMERLIKGIPLKKWQEPSDREHRPLMK